MTDDELDRLCIAARFGEAVEAQSALIEIVRRILTPKRLPPRAAAALGEFLFREFLESKPATVALTVFQPPGRRKKKGRPSGHGLPTALLVNQLRAECEARGHKDTENADPIGMDPLWLAVAKRMGFSEDAAETEAARLRRSVQRARREAKPKAKKRRRAT